MDTTNLIKRGHTYSVRIAIPRHLQDALGKREIVRSLHTTSLAEANRLKHAVIAEIRVEIADAERAHEGPTFDTPVDRLLTELRTLRWKHRVKPLSKEELHDKMETLLGYAHDLDDTGNIPDEPTEQAIQDAFKAVTDSKVILMSEAVRKYLDAHQPPIITPQTYDTKKKRLSELQLYLRSDLDIRHVTGQMAGDYITDNLLKRIKSPKTAKDYITDLSAMFKWCKLKDMVPENPFIGKTGLVKESKRGTTNDSGRRPWWPDELLRFAKGAPLEDRYYRLVFFILGLYTGARLNELAELKRKDVYEDHIKITEGKSPAARRSIPLHPVLVPLVHHLQQVSTDKYLVPGLLRGGANKRRGHYVSKRFTPLRRKLGVTDPGCCYHSLRGNLITALEQARVPVNEIEQLVGHKRPSLALGGYSRGVDFERLREDVALVTFGTPVDSLVTRRIGELLAGASG